MQHYYKTAKSPTDRRVELNLVYSIIIKNRTFEAVSSQTGYKNMIEEQKPKGDGILLLILKMFLQIQDEFRSKKKTIGIVAGGLILLFFIISLTTGQKNDVSNATSVAVGSARTNVVAEADREADIKQKAKNYLEDANTELSKPFNILAYRGSVGAVREEVNEFARLADIIISAQLVGDANDKKLSTSLVKKLKSVQVVEFPKIRKEYGKEAAKELWEENMEVIVGGQGNKTITLIASMFVDNKNIAVMQKKFEQHLKAYRFSRIQYKWYHGEDRYTYYSIESPKDNELIVLQ